MKFLRKKYKQVSGNIENAGDSVSKSMLKNFELIKAEYLYHAVLSDSLEDINEINPNRMDYISVIEFSLEIRVVRIHGGTLPLLLIF